MMRPESISVSLPGYLRHPAIDIGSQRRKPLQLKFIFHLPVPPPSRGKFLNELVAMAEKHRANAVIPERVEDTR